MKTSTHKTHRMHRTRGISKAHAFAVGRATGVRINASHEANVGAALHSSKKRREMARKRFSSSSSHKFSSKSNALNNEGVNIETPELDLNLEEVHSRSNKLVFIFFIPFIIIFIFMIIMMVFTIARII